MDDCLYLHGIQRFPYLWVFLLGVYVVRKLHEICIKCDCRPYSELHLRMMNA